RPLPDVAARHAAEHQAHPPAIFLTSTRRENMRSSSFPIRRPGLRNTVAMPNRNERTLRTTKLATSMTAAVRIRGVKAGDFFPDPAQPKFSSTEVAKTAESL